MERMLSSNDGVDLAPDEAGSIHEWFKKQGISVAGVSIRADGSIDIEGSDIDPSLYLPTYVEERSAQAFDKEVAYRSRIDSLTSINLDKADLAALRIAVKLMRDLVLSKEG
jgi:hypothetical protein